MRESLTIFAIALIALLSALLVGPYFVDWNGQRDWLAAKLSETIGARVRIDGTVDVKLLPRPLFRAAHVSIAGATPQDPSVSADGLDAELSINSLLQGAVEFVDATLLQPRLSLTVRDDGTLVAGAWDVSNPQRFMFRHVRLRNGAILVRDTAGHSRATLSGLDAEGEAETLFGPLRVSGRATTEASPFRFRLVTGAYAGRHVRLKLVVDDLPPFGRADLDGTLALAPGPDRKGAAPSFSGSLAATGSLRVADGFAPVPWRLAAGDLKADGQGLSASALELRAGGDDRALVANGAVLLDFGAVPSAAVRLTARQLDLDRLAVVPESAPDTPRPRAAQWLAALQGFASGQAAPRSRLKLDWGIDAVTSGDLTLTDAKGSLDLAAGAPVRGRFAIAGPDGFRLALDGALERGAGAVFRGKVDAASHNLAATSGWLAPLMPDAADWLSAHAGAQDVAVSGQFDLSATGVAARDLSLHLDGSGVTGAGTLTRGVGSEPPRLFADLKADTLDIGRLPALADLQDSTEGLDLSVAVAAPVVKLARPGLAPVVAGPLAVHLSKAGAAVTLDRLSLDGLDGASLSATGTLAADRGLQAHGRIAARDVAPLAALLRQALPSGAADALADRAALLSPLALDWSLNGSLGRDGRFVPTLATAKGSAAATRISATVTPEPARLFAAPAVSLLAVLDAPEATLLLRQFGAEVPSAVPPVGLGTSHVEVTARGTPETGYDTHLAATVGDATFGFDGRSDGATGQGRGKASGRNAGALLIAMGLPGLGAAAAPNWDVAADLGWDAVALRAEAIAGHGAGSAVKGSLSRTAATGAVSGALTLDTLALPSLTGLLLGPPAQAPAVAGRSFGAAPFGPPSTALPPLQVGLQVDRLDLGQGSVLTHAALKLGLAPGTLTLGDLTGDLAGGKAGATLTLRRDGTRASLSGQVHVDGLKLALPSLAGTLSASVGLAGSGTSPDALAASLAGDGAFSLTGALPHFDPRALADVAKAYEGDGATLDPDRIRTALSAALDRAPVDLGTLAGPVTLAAGTLRTGVLNDTVAAGTVTTEASADLRSGLLMLRATLTGADLPQGWQGDAPSVVVTWRGPPTAPVREVDAGAFANGLAARAIAREQDRIQLMQDDLRERAFFARRLRAMEAERAARDAAAREAAEKARAAAAAPVPPSRPAATDPVARLLNTLPAPPPVPPSRPLDARPEVPALSPSADPLSDGRF